MLTAKREILHLNSRPKFQKSVEMIPAHVAAAKNIKNVVWDNILILLQLFCMLPVFYNCRTTLNLNPGHIWISKWFSQIRIPLFRNESGILYLLTQNKWSFFKRQRSDVFMLWALPSTGLSPGGNVGMLASGSQSLRFGENIGLRLLEPAPRREKWALGYWNVGLMVKFVISPEYSGYWEKILAYWDIAKKFAFPRLQYYIGCYLHNCINCTFSPKMVLRRFSTCNPKMGRGNRIRLNKSGMWSWNITLVLENDNG